MKSGYALPRAAPYGRSGSAAGRPTHHVPSSARSGRSVSIALAAAGPKCADVALAIALFTRSASERTPTDPGRREARCGGGGMTPLSPVGAARMFRCARPKLGSTIAGSASPPVGAGGRGPPTRRGPVRRGRGPPSSRETCPAADAQNLGVVGVQAVIGHEAGRLACHVGRPLGRPAAVRRVHPRRRGPAQQLYRWSHRLGMNISTRPRLKSSSASRSGPV
jgi:hypothetical protein